ncbi:MAG: FAD-dependent oxidoreductase [Lachnospiraceae bacterium]|nr:FAD-dependent oxidoreductase [Lachnospiraceae bacterium]
METYDVAVIGCGVSGAAIAYELSKYDLRILILEKENDVATGATKANSGIMHAGFDPKPGSLMAKLNVRGSALARAALRKLDVPYKECGAMVVAFSEEEKEILERLYQQGIENGVQNQELLTGEEARRLEPNLSEEVKWALLENDSAIVSPWEFALALAETAVKNGAQLILNREVTGLKEGNNLWQIETKIAEGALLQKEDAKETSFAAKVVINAAGLNAGLLRDRVLPPRFQTRPKRGQYYLLDKSEGTRVTRTIFQAPTGRGKGILVSPTVHGNLIVGPNSEDVIGNDTATSWDGLDKVSEAAKKSVPTIDFSQNIRNFSGVRARTDEDDFILERHGSYIDAAGICSPGLSSALAIGEYVIELFSQWAEESKTTLVKKETFIDERKKVRFKELSAEQKEELIKKDPAYAHVVCRCETITEGEIRDAFETPIPPVSLDGVKRRTGTGMGRCQGGFCGPQIAQLLAKELGIPETKVLQELTGSEILTEEMAGRAQEGGR